MVSVSRDLRGREPGELNAGKEDVLLFLKRGGRGRRVTRPRNTAFGCGCVP